MQWRTAGSGFLGYREECERSSQGKKVADGRCGRTIEAQPVCDQTCPIEDVVVAPGLINSEELRRWLAVIDRPPRPTAIPSAAHAPHHPPHAPPRLDRTHRLCRRPPLMGPATSFDPSRTTSTKAVTTFLSASRVPSLCPPASLQWPGDAAGIRSPFGPSRRDPNTSPPAKAGRFPNHRVPSGRPFRLQGGKRPARAQQGAIKRRMESIGEIRIATAARPGFLDALGAEQGQPQEAQQCGPEGEPGPTAPAHRAPLVGRERKAHSVLLTRATGTARNGLKAAATLARKPLLKLPEISAFGS